MSLGTVISVSFTGLLAAVLGWEEVFYVQGGMSLVFVVLWFAFVYDSPEKHPWISDAETELINEGREDSHGPVSWGKTGSVQFGDHMQVF